jgi:hypothetical protein
MTCVYTHLRRILTWNSIDLLIYMMSTRESTSCKDKIKPQHLYGCTKIRTHTEGTSYVKFYNMFVEVGNA